MPYNTLVVLIGSALLGALCGAVGSFAVLRRQALLGDVVAHCSLLGVAMAYLVTRTKSIPVLLMGAAVSAVLGAWLLVLIRRTKTREDAAQAIVLSVLYGAGIVASRWIQNTIPDGSKAGLDSFLLGRASGIVREDLFLLTGACILIFGAIIVGFRELRLLAFDSGYAQSLGWPVRRLDFAVIALTTLTVVFGLPLVGVVLTAALLILPALAARFWSDRLERVVLLAAVLGAASAALGVLVSATTERAPTGPVIVLLAGGVFLISAVLAPRTGLLSTRLAALSFARDEQERVRLLKAGSPDSASRLAELTRRSQEALDR